MIKAWIDGACGPTNPHGAMAWAIIIETGTQTFEISNYEAQALANTNNLAEYKALRSALHWLKEYAFLDSPITIYSDSKMLVSQMKGDWGINGGAYVDIADECVVLAELFDDLRFEWIGRQLNKRADNICARALRKALAKIPDTF